VGIGVGTYTQANTRSGNLFTAVPIVGWSGKGPAMSMMLYHNAANVTSILPLTRGMGFSLGEGWTTSYSAQLILNQTPNPTIITAIADDGTLDVFTLEKGQWVAPPGIYDVIEAIGNEWHLVHKDQSKHVFDSEGLLLRVEDDAGNFISIFRSNGHISSIVDSSGRSLDFQYSLGILFRIIDPAETQGTASPERSWTFTYNGGRIHQLSDAMCHLTTFTHDTSGRIASIKDKECPSTIDENICFAATADRCVAVGADGDSMSYSYTNGRIRYVHDPIPDDPLEPQLRQQFAFTAIAGGAFRGRYFDRRGSLWAYEYDANANLRTFDDPLLHRRTFVFEAGTRNLLSYKDALNNEWTFAYDDRGNLLTAADPLTHQRAWTYDAFNNVASYTDAEDQTVSFLYEIPALPTLLTSVIEPADGQANPAAVTELAWFQTKDDGGPPGELWYVIDPNGVRTFFEYDNWGQLRKYSEGEVEPFSWVGVYEETTDFDGASRLKSSSGPGNGPGVLLGPGGAGGNFLHDLNNNAVAEECIAVFAGGGRSADGKESEVPFDGTLGVPPGFPKLPCSAPGLPRAEGNWSASYTPMGRLVNQTVGMSELSDGIRTRTHSMTYDQLGRERTASIESDEQAGVGNEITRGFQYNPNWQTGTFTRVGPDGVETLVQTDVANRVTFVRRGPSGSPLMTATYTYYNDDRVQSITYGNGASVHYEYDTARRLTEIDHKDSIGDTFLEMEYTYYNDDLPATITESDMLGVTAIVTFAYDNRNRLIDEERDAPGAPSTAYDLEYTYDQGGNRLTKVDAINERLTEYHYDLEDPESYESKNNRLMYYDVFDTSNQSSTLESTTYYYYNASGNPTRIVTRPASGNSRTATRFGYAKNGQTVSYVVGESWTDNGTNCPTGYTVSFVNEYRYDSGRARYLSRRVFPLFFQQSGALVPISDSWSDYDGDEIYGHYLVGGPSLLGEASKSGDSELHTRGTPTITELNSYEPGLWRSDGSVSAYLHNDHLGTLRQTSATTGSPESQRVFSAFGEPIVSGGDRYGYVGAWGYQSHDGFSYLHIGARYYDPASGRFLQRDSIGVNGGRNVYDYVSGRPSHAIDPSGMIGDQDLKTDRHIFEERRRREREEWERNHPRPDPQYQDSSWNRFWNHSFWDWLDDPQKVDRVDRISRGVAVICITGALAGVGALVNTPNAWALSSAGAAGSAWFLL